MAKQKSTIVRFSRRAQLTALRTAFRIGERVAPGTAAAWAEGLWFRLPSVPVPGPRPTGLPPSSPATARLGRGGLAGESWGDGPAVYLVHGWGGRRTQLDPFVAPLVRAGFRVLAHDAPSHGESDAGREGRHSTTLLEMADALTAFVAEHGPAYGLVAHSAGAQAVALALRDGLPAKRVVFLSPMEHPEPYTYEFARQFGFGERTRQAMIERSGQRIGVSWDYFDLPGMAGQLTPPPVLVIHDREDRETSWSGGAALAEAWGGRLVTTTGLGHRRILRDPGVLTQATEFLRS